MVRLAGEPDESKVRRKLVVVATVLALALGMTACKEKRTSEEVSDAAKATGKAVEDATKK